MSILRQLLDKRKLEWGELYHYREDFEMIILAEKKIIANSEEYTKILEKDFLSKVEKDIHLSATPENEEQESDQALYYEHYYGRVERVIEQVLQSQRKASVLSIFSIIEGQLKILHDLIQKEFSLTKKLEKEGDYIRKYLCHLENVYGIDLSSLEGIYDEIKKNKDVKNIIAHSNSIVKPSKVEAINLIDGLSVSSCGLELHITNDTYVLALLSKADSFFKELLKLIDNRYKEKKTVGNKS